MSIHPTAIVASGAQIDPTAEVGAYSIIGPDITIGARTRLISHVVVDGHTAIGEDNVIYPFTSIGVPPQDLKYGGEPTRCQIGDRNTIRESVTISRGTVKGGGLTRMGSDNLLMCYVHIGHDSQVGSNIIMANNATLAGHVTIEDFASVGAFCPVHQFSTVGQYAFIGGGTIVTQDVLPFTKTSARRENKAFGINSVGLERRGFSPERLAGLKKIYRLLLSSKRNTTQALDEIKKIDSDDARLVVGFIERSHRGVIK